MSLLQAQRFGAIGWSKGRRASAGTNRAEGSGIQGRVWLLRGLGVEGLRGSGFGV